MSALSRRLRDLIARPFGGDPQPEPEVTGESGDLAALRAAFAEKAARGEHDAALYWRITTHPERGK